MNKETLHLLLDVQESATTDPEYLLLHEDYALAQQGLLRLMEELSEEQRQLLGNYLASSVNLHHRLMVLAIQWPNG